MAEYSTNTSGNGIWLVIGAVAVAFIVVVALFNAGGGSSDLETAVPGAVDVPADGAGGTAAPVPSQ